MRNKWKLYLSLLLCLCLAASPVAVFADPGNSEADAAATDPAAEQETETEQEEIPAAAEVIASEEDFLAFAENCRLDTYSKNRNVMLVTDLDLTGTEFTGIPIFSGVFDGGGHTIRGLSVTEDGSFKGLFRYLDATAEVCNLTVEGSVLPGGSRCEVGGIAGSNAGTITGCTFRGEVSGADYVGGIAGINEVSGIIEDCRIEGTVHGTHYVGGMAGENWGVIRSCVSAAEINTTAEQNSVELSDITLESLTGSESVSTATDIGGIVGANSGVVRDCRNDGAVGYIHIGYNIGGIAGSQIGYLTGCVNYGTVSGRKEVGGIAGQMEPSSLLRYDVDTLQTLEGQLDTLDGLTGQASANAQGSVSQLQGQIGAVETELQKARDAVDLMLPEDREELEALDRDTLLAAQNTLSSSLTAITGQIGSIAATTQSAADTLIGDLNAVVGQMNVIGGTIGNASAGLGGTITDVSDADTDIDTAGKVEACKNFGPVRGDLNTGGVIGAASVENDFDPEDDLQITGESSLNFDYEARAVVLRCENYGTVTARNRNAGGISGWMSMGLIRECLNNGRISAQAANYVGGIAGRSDGFVRSCYANCALYGSSFVGGISGSGVIVTDCRSMVQFHGGSENLGAILGVQEEMRTSDVQNPVSGNVYLTVDEDHGGIDGVSYGGRAEPLAEAEFLALEGLPEVFHVITVRFLFEDGSEETLTMRPGAALKTEDMPVLPQKEGYAAQWVGPSWVDPEHVSFDADYTAVYTAYRSVLETEEADETGKPLVLVQGRFAENQMLTLTEASGRPLLAEKETALLTRGMVLPESIEPMQLRALLPDGETGSGLRVMVQDGAGNWRDAESSVSRSYLVFDVQDGDTAFCVVRIPKDYRPVWWMAGGGGLLLLLIVGIAVGRKAKKKKK